MTLNPIIISVAAVGLVVFLFVALMIGILLYQNHWHPLARLREKVSIGDECDEILTMFEKYVDEHGSSETQLGDTHFLRHAIPAFNYRPREIGIYDVFFMDDLQLNVVCDSSENVARIQWIGD